MHQASGDRRLVRVAVSRTWFAGSEQPSSTECLPPTHLRAAVAHEPRACLGRRGCATSTTASARPRSAERHPLHASQGENSRAPPAPSSRRSSAAETVPDHEPQRSRRCHASNRRRNLVPLPPSANLLAKRAIQPHRRVLGRWGRAAAYPCQRHCLADLGAEYRRPDKCGSGADHSPNLHRVLQA